MVVLIDACSTVDELAALYVYNNDTPPIRPLGDFPLTYFSHGRINNRRINSVLDI